MSVSVPTLALLALVVLGAGAINGVAGFGFAIVGTMALATTVDPAVAVAFMIFPILSVNLALVRELSTSEVRECAERFWPLVTAAVVGTVVGLAVLQRAPTSTLKLGLGTITLAFVASSQQAIPVPALSRVEEGCFVESPLPMVGLGAVSGALFGGTNVGVQFVAYLRSCDLSHSLFVGVLAMVFVGLNGVRVVAAGALGLYPSPAFVGGSLAACVPAVAGVAVGQRFRDRIAEGPRRLAVLGLLTLIGIRLVLGGLGV